MKYELVKYGVTDSTNKRAKEYAKKRDTGCHLPVVFIADGQTAGRGRLGRSFHSEAGVGIYISFLTYPDLSPSDATAVTAYAAVKLCRAISAFTDADCRIKWVNDLTVNGKKLAGILTEGEISADGRLSYCVCGIGLNLYKSEMPEELSAIATSLEEVTGVRVDKEALTKRLIEEFLSDGDYRSSDVLEEYRKRSSVLGKRITVHTPSGTYPAVAREILDDYSLLIETDRGERRRIYTGEISIRL